ncbi:MAG: outer membrane protein assembly factor BamD [Ectothiorhodospiraceae bacterium]|nr:outer membrane protein assembly factor BamD [Ectothiorhodospiraceae bacterium]
MMPLRILLLSLLAATLVSGCAGSRSGHDFDPNDPFAAQRSEQTAEEMYQEARRLLDRRDYRGAAERLENLQARYPFGAYFRQAQLDLIYAHYKSWEMSSAIAAADRFMRLHPQDPNVAYALYMRGLANLERGNDFLTRTFRIDRRTRDPEPARQAFNDLSELVQRFPDSEYVEDAQERMADLRNHLAHYELHVANYYVKRGAYVAAANRAMGILENYQGTPAVQDALGILASAYRELELEDLREDVMRVIRENYPDHPSLTPGVFDRLTGEAG